ncbi:hypothetical protein EXH51_24065 [Pelomonas saccharophila]|nr:hypothetical protein [Roseateles saccharophilus]
MRGSGGDPPAARPREGHKSFRTIARQLHVHRDTVRRVLAQAGISPPTTAPRPSRIDLLRIPRDRGHRSAVMADSIPP